MDNYLEKIEYVKFKTISYLKEIFKVYGNELLLKLEEYNLLESPKNCIETSTATGFIIEEFITSKLETYTKKHNNFKEVKIERENNGATVNKSYDCIANFKKILFLINIKVEKDGSNNNAVAAINLLYNDYVKTQPKQEKSYIIVKIKYRYGVSKKDQLRKILIKDIDGYCLEEIDFSGGHQQDHRNWSKTFKEASGRLQVSNVYRKKNCLPKKDISYYNTRKYIENIYEKN